MPQSTPSIPAEPDNGRAPARPRWPWALAAGAAAAGLLAGGAIVAGFGIDGNTNAQTVQARATPAVTVPSAGSPSSGTDVHISQSCLQAISDAEQIYSQLGPLVKAASTLNAASLDTVVRRLQALQSTLRPSATACRATVSLPSAQPVPSNSPAPAKTATPAS
ncbi:MAG: hypothetical protein ACR2MP_24245 [Streptosporangiaceae bacterium]